MSAKMLDVSHHLCNGVHVFGQNDPLVKEENVYLMQGCPGESHFLCIIDRPHGTKRAAGALSLCRQQQHWLNNDYLGETP